ncbi:MAG TPA: T9SS type A sorting domain-containing protein [Bacteroidia bacterium]|nr:T9SS type A sorting domain-containing protein [Bacteroidia bacterium]
MKKMYFLISLSLATVLAKAQCVVQVSGTNIQCHGMANGSATATPVGVPNYSYMWTPGGMTTATVSGLSPGTYTVTVVDGASCTSTGTITITEPAVVSATSTQTNVACPGTCTGVATAFVSGGTPSYTHKWTTTPVQTTATATNLCAGTYRDSITDSKGCKTILAVTITQPGPFTASVICGGISCFGAANGTATASQSGGTPGYSYLWNTSQTTKTISGLSPGTYTCTVKDTNGCTSSASCTVNQPSAALSVSATGTNASCSSCCNGSASATPSGGTSAYTYSWSPGGQTTQTINGVCPGNYTVCVTDAHGCNTCGQVSVNFNSGINQLPDYAMKFYPNPTSGDFDIEITPSFTDDVKLILMDIIGNEIYSETINVGGANKSKVSVQTQPSGIYFLKMKIKDTWITQKLIKY